MNKIFIEVQAAEEADDILNALSKVFEVTNVEIMGNDKISANIENKKIKTGRKQRFTDQGKETIRMYRFQGMTINDIAKMFKCSPGTIHNIVKGY